MPCSSSMSTSFSTVATSQFPTVRLCFGPSCTTSLNLIYVALISLPHQVVVATLQRANHQSVAQCVLQHTRSSVRRGSRLARLVRATRSLFTLSRIARHVRANRLVRTVLRGRVVGLVEAAEQRREIQFARMHPCCQSFLSPTAGCGTRTRSSRRARCSRRSPPAPDIYVAPSARFHSSHSSSSFFTYATISYACGSSPRPPPRHARCSRRRAPAGPGSSSPPRRCRSPTSHTPAIATAPNCDFAQNSERS